MLLADNIMYRWLIICNLINTCIYCRELIQYLLLIWYPTYAVMSYYDYRTHHNSNELYRYFYTCEFHMYITHRNNRQDGTINTNECKKNITTKKFNTYFIINDNYIVIFCRSRTTSFTAIILPHLLYIIYFLLYIPHIPYII